MLDLKIVVLDGKCVNPGDLSWDGLARFGDLTVYDRTSPEQLVDRLSGADVVFTNKTLLTEEAINSAPSLKYISVMATGYNVVDIEAAGKRGIAVSNAPAYSTDSVAQMAISMILETAFRVGEHSRAVHMGDWVRSKDFCFWSGSLVELSGKTLGIYGYGSIGKRTAKIAAALGMKILAYNRSAVPGTCDEFVEFADKQRLFSESEYLSLHCPLNAESKELINKETIALLPDGAVVINTARGGCVNPGDVREALDSGKLAWYCADVSASEPQSSDDPLLNAPNCILTPHISWATREARLRLMKINEANLEAFVNGKPINVIN